ncbi:hypothetical protein HDV06_000589 [Boothiomyces sp. JEL0866]|nr:hypothetical protein HDV06_000589 [Boothiomyces sp. JEL0866]
MMISPPGTPQLKRSRYVQIKEITPVTKYRVIKAKLIKYFGFVNGKHQYLIGDKTGVAILYLDIELEVGFWYEFRNLKTWMVDGFVRLVLLPVEYELIEPEDPVTDQKINFVLNISNVEYEQIFE